MHQHREHTEQEGGAEEFRCAEDAHLGGERLDQREDETADGNIRARQNVIHELGKFQERFGNNKTIVLAEKGSELPSNISGIIYVGFEPGHIKATFGDIVAAINREVSLW